VEREREQDDVGRGRADLKRNEGVREIILVVVVVVRKQEW
jgi:hypothetical protein